MIVRALVAALATPSQTSRPVRRRALALSAAPLAAFVIGALLASAAKAQTAPQHSAFVPGQLIVKFRAGLDAAERADALHDRGLRLRRSRAVAHTALVALPDGAAIGPAISALERDPRVVRAEPNPYREAGGVPNDPFLAEQWGLINSGQPVDGVAGTADADIDAAEAWDVTTGSPDVKVAVVDSGINFDQPDLAPNIWRNPGESGGGREFNGVDDDGNGFVDDLHGWDFVQGDGYPSDNEGHGTLVAGTLAARGDNGLGISGVAGHVTLIPVRVLGNTGLGTCDLIASGMAYAVRAGARIVNVSIGSPKPCQLERDVIDAAPNTLFVFSAMNDGADVDAAPNYPCGYPSPNIVCVAATDSRDRLAGFSNYGAHNVDLAAPGERIFSTYLKWGPTQEVYGDDFETPLTGRWVTGGTPDTWARTPFVETRSGAYALSNSLVGGYPNNAQNWAQLQGLDLSGRRDCGATIWVKKSLGASAEDDVLIADPSADGIHPGGWMSGQLGTNAGFEQWLIDLAPLDGHSTGSLRFWLDTDGSGTFGGVALDDLRIFCVPPLTSYTGAHDEFGFVEGTSFAAPQVSGVAALVLSLDPGLTATRLKQRILATVDPLPSLAGKTVSGGRLNAARAVTPDAPSASAPPVGAAPGGRHADAVAKAMAGQVRAIARALRTAGIRALLQRGGLARTRLLVPGAGRLTLKVTSARRTIATGACAAARAERCPFDIRLTRRGRALLRRARHLRATVALAFAPRSGSPIVKRATVRLVRSPSKSRHGGSR